jgi:hypothetical protein
MLCKVAVNKLLGLLELLVEIGFGIHIPSDFDDLLLVIGHVAMIGKYACKSSEFAAPAGIEFSPPVILCCRQYFLKRGFI